MEEASTGNIIIGFAVLYTLLVVVVALERLCSGIFIRGELALIKRQKRAFVPRMEERN